MLSQILLSIIRNMLRIKVFLYEVMKLSFFVKLPNNCLKILRKKSFKYKQHFINIVTHGIFIFCTAKASYFFML